MYICIVYVAIYSLWKKFLIFVSYCLIEFLFNTHDFIFHKLNRTAHHSNKFCCIQYPLIYQQNSQFAIIVLFIIGRYWNYMLLAKTYLGTMYKVGTRSSYKHCLCKPKVW